MGQSSVAGRRWKRPTLWSTFGQTDYAFGQPLDPKRQALDDWLAGGYASLDMPEIDAEQVAARRRVEDDLLSLGREREAFEHNLVMNRQKIRALLVPAREADITITDIARMTGFSTQTLHTWMRGTRLNARPGTSPTSTSKC